MRTGLEQWNQFTDYFIQNFGTHFIGPGRESAVNKEDTVSVLIELNIFVETDRK